MEDAGSGQAAVSLPTSTLHVALLRGSPLRVVLRRGGRIFENSEGTAESHDLSSEVDHIDTFVSHTWSTPRRKKFLPLSFHFCFLSAYATSWFIGLVVSVLGALRVLSFVGLESFQGLDRVPNGPYGLCLCPLLFWLVVFFDADLVQVLPARERQVFLDKVCN